MRTKALPTLILLFIGGLTVGCASTPSVTSAGNSPTSTPSASAETKPSSTDKKSSSTEKKPSTTDKPSSESEKLDGTFEPTDDEATCVSKFRKSNEDLFDSSVDLNSAQTIRLFEGYASCLDHDRFVEYVIAGMHQRLGLDREQLDCLNGKISALSDDEIIEQIGGGEAFASIRKACDA